MFTAFSFLSKILLYFQEKEEAERKEREEKAKKEPKKEPELIAFES